MIDTTEFITCFHKNWEATRRFSLSSYFDLADAGNYESQFTLLLFDLLRRGPHKLLDKPLKMFLQMIGAVSDGKFTVQKGFAFDEGIPDLVIERSVNGAVKGTIFLENKPFAPEGWKQLDRYTKELRKMDREERVLVFLPGYWKRRYYSTDDANHDVRRIVVPYLKSVRLKCDERAPTSVEEWLEKLLSGTAGQSTTEEQIAAVTIGGALDLIRATFSGGREAMMETTNELQSLLEENPEMWRKAFEVNRAFAETVENLRKKVLKEISDEIAKAALDQLGDQYVRSNNWHGSLADKFSGPFVRKTSWPKNIAAGISAESGNGCSLILGICAPTAEDAEEDKATLTEKQCQELRDYLTKANARSHFPARCSIKANSWWPWYLDKGLEDIGSDESMARIVANDRHKSLVEELSNSLSEIAKTADVALSQII